jgi:hypothetical protein
MQVQTIIVNVGEARYLEVLIDQVLDDSVYALYQNDEAITAATVLEDLTEADFGGYDAMDGDLAALANVWSEPALEEDGAWSSTGDTVVEWIRGDSGGDNTIYGALHKDSLGNLLQVLPFVDENGDPAPFLMEEEGATIRLTPYFSTQERREVKVGPQLTAATIAVAGDTLTLDFDRVVAGSDTFTLDATGGAVSITYDSGAPGTSLVFLPDRTILGAETVTLDYAAGDVVDADGRPLPAIDDFEVTNNSTEV